MVTNSFPQVNQQDLEASRGTGQPAPIKDETGQVVGYDWSVAQDYRKTGVPTGISTPTQMQPGGIWSKSSDIKMPWETGQPFEPTTMPPEIQYPTLTSPNGWNVSYDNSAQQYHSYTSPDGKVYTPTQLLYNQQAYSDYIKGFSDTEMAVAATWAQNNAEEFVNSIRRIGDRPETRHLMSYIYPDKPNSFYDGIFNSILSSDSKINKLSDIAGIPFTPQVKEELYGIVDSSGVMVLPIPKWLMLLGNAALTTALDINDPTAMLEGIQATANFVTQKQRELLGLGDINWLGKDGLGSISYKLFQPLRDLTLQYNPEDMDPKNFNTPKFWNAVQIASSEMIPSLVLGAVQMIASSGAATPYLLPRLTRMIKPATALGRFSVQFLTNFGGQSILSAINSFKVGGSIHDQMLVNGASPEDANKAGTVGAGLSFGINQILGSLLMTEAFNKFPLVKNPYLNIGVKTAANVGIKTGEFAITGVTNAMFPLAQEWAVSQATGQPFEMTPDKQMALLFYLGAGFGMKGAGEIMGSVHNRAVANLTARQNAELQVILDKETQRLNDMEVGRLQTAKVQEQINQVQTKSRDAFWAQQEQTATTPTEIKNVWDKIVQDSETDRRAKAIINAYNEFLRMYPDAEPAVMRAIQAEKQSLLTEVYSVDKTNDINTAKSTEPSKQVAKPVAGKETIGQPLESVKPPVNASSEQGRPQQAKGGETTTPLEIVKPQGPVESQGKLVNTSKIADIWKQYADVTGEHNQMNIKDQLAKGADYISTANDKEAQLIAMGYKTPPAGLTDVSVGLNYASKLRTEGRPIEAGMIEQTIISRSTRRGQENVMLRSVNDDSPMSAIKDAINSKTENVAKNIKGKGTAKDKISEVVKPEVEQLKQQIKQKDIETAKSIFDNLTCKD